MITLTLYHVWRERYGEQYIDIHMCNSKEIRFLRKRIGDWENVGNLPVSIVVDYGCTLVVIGVNLNFAVMKEINF